MSIGPTIFLSMLFFYDSVFRRTVRLMRSTTVGIACDYPVEGALYGVCHHVIFMKVRAVVLYMICHNKSLL